MQGGSDVDWLHASRNAAVSDETHLNSRCPVRDATSSVVKEVAVVALRVVWRG